MQIIDLPLELLVEVLTYLPKKFRQNKAWKICRQFREACTHPRFKYDFRLNLKCAHLDKNGDPVQNFEDSERVFNEVVFQDTTFGDDYEDFVSHMCQYVEILVIKYKQKNIKSEQLAFIIGCCKSLKVLKLELAQGIGIILNATPNQMLLLQNGLRFVETLELTGPLEVRIDTLFELLDSMPRLKYLDLTKLDVFRSEEKQFYDSLIPFISRHACTLKGILFQPDFKPESLKKYERLVEIKNLKLEQFGATAVQEFRWSESEYQSFRQFLQNNCELNDLRLNSSEKLEWGQIMGIIKQQKHLKRLEVDAFSFFLSVEAGLLYLLPEIETIIFTESMDHEHAIWPQIDKECLVPEVNVTLKELIISKFYALYTETWLNCEYKCLTRLEIRDSELEDSHVHLICEKLPMLEDLTITSSLITDFAISGRPKRKGRIETEKVTTAICDLQHLRILALDYDEKITSSAFENLNDCWKTIQILSLEGCERINHNAIMHLVSHCPHLQFLNISFCSKIKNESILLICEKLQNLRCLKINELPALTTAVFQSIGDHAKNLRFLHMKDYVKIQNVETYAKDLFNQLENLRMIKLAHQKTIHRIDSN